MLRKLLAASAAVLVLSGCASGLNSRQAQEYHALDAQGLLIQEKNPTTAALLGLLPGGGSFYARQPGYGVLNLLTWPLSMLWDPISGHDAATVINYQASVAHVRREKLKELGKLRDDHREQRISAQELSQGMRDIGAKYEY